MVVEARCIFDADDIDAILTMPDGERTVWRFTPVELKRQIHSCEVQSAVCRSAGDDWEFVYLDLKAAMELAADILLSQRPKPKPIPGRERIDFQAIRSRNDIVVVAERYTRLRKSGQRFSGKCPLHDSKGLPLTIYPDDQSFYCFHCLKGGDVLDMVMFFENCDFKAAAERLR